MRQISNKIIFTLSFFLFAAALQAAPVVRKAAGADAAAIQAAVDQFRADLGGALNPNNTNSFPTGRREINWDGVPDALSSPNNLPANFFNSNSPRGAVFGTPCGPGQFRVSANAVNPTNTPVRFGELDPSYVNTFTTFSPQRLFTAISNLTSPCNIVSINFFIPGTNVPATVSGFGAVFTDVDLQGNARILCYDKSGAVLPPGSLEPAAANNGLSFIGVSYDAGERITRCDIVSGNARLVAGNVDVGANGVDVVAMDDFIYSEPHAAEFHSTDFDGDGAADLAVFRPTTGQWFILNSGTSTFSFFNFGVPGDIPVDGDFDGDARADLTVFRPSTNTWFRLNSSDGGFVVQAFGAAGDRPVAADYDKDGKTDFAVFRPSTGQFFTLRSKTGQFTVTNWGANGDIPLAGAAN